MHAIDDTYSIQNGSDKGQIYLCCGKNDQVGCSTLPTHHFAPINADIILQFSTSTTAPSPDPLRPKRAAIALDCEMVAVHGEWRQVAHLAAVDYITGETLIDTLIQPTVEVVDWGSEITGISEASMSEAIQRSRALPGWSAARQTLWEFMDSDTVLVGQSLQFDLEVLAMLHTRIVDSEILTTSAVRLEGGRKRGLKELCKSILRLDIQGREHSAREDALAARELVLVLCGQEKRFKAWADKVRQTEGARLEERRKRREIQERECAVKGA